MIYSGYNEAKAILIDGEFIKNIFIGDVVVYTQSIAKLKFSTTDKFELVQLDRTTIG